MASHEIAHALVIRLSYWRPECCQNRTWLGRRANKLYESLGCDSSHFWPNGMNSDLEERSDLYVKNALTVDGILKDMSDGCEK